MTPRLEVGVEYEAVGPHGQRLEVVEIDEDAKLYRTRKTAGTHAADVIRFGCEDAWRPVADPVLDVGPTVWHDGRLCAFDCETTGVDVEEARIVTAAVAVCGGGLATEMLSLLADPGIEIPDGAAEVHGITTERARAEGAPARDVIAAVLEAIRPYVETGCPIVAFNARFELTILDREARRHGLEPLGDLLVIDPLVIDKHLHRYRKGSRKLDAQCAHYGAELADAHEAAADAIAAARVAWCIGKRGEVIRRVRNASEGRELAALKREWERVRHDLRLLHGAQVRWAADQAASLADYFRGQGKHEDATSVQPEWPLVPFREAEAVAA